jgi:hypothetical protein
LKNFPDGVLPFLLVGLLGVGVQLLAVYDLAAHDKDGGVVSEDLLSLDENVDLVVFEDDVVGFAVFLAERLELVEDRGGEELDDLAPAVVADEDVVEKVVGFHLLRLDDQLGYYGEVASGQAFMPVNKGRSEGWNRWELKPGLFIPDLIGRNIKVSRGL